MFGVKFHNQVSLAVNHITIDKIIGDGVKQGNNYILIVVDKQVVVGKVGDAQVHSAISVLLDIDTQIALASRILGKHVHWPKAVCHEQRVGELEKAGRHLVKDITQNSWQCCTITLSNKEIGDEVSVTLLHNFAIILTSANVKVMIWDEAHADVLGVNYVCN